MAGAIGARYGKRRGPLIHVQIIPDTLSADVADHAGAEIRSEIQALDAGKRLGAITDYRIAVLDHDDISTASGRVRGYALVAPTKRATTVVVSLVLVYVLRASLVRVQSEVPLSEWRKTDIPVFAHALVALLATHVRQARA